MRTLLYDLFIGWWFDVPPTLMEQRKMAWGKPGDNQ